MLGSALQAVVSRLMRLHAAWCRKGLKIALTLHHFVQPLWFEDLGGFTKGDNIKHFTSFACVAFR